MQPFNEKKVAAKTESESWFSVPKGLIKAMFVTLVVSMLVEDVAARSLGTGKYYVAKNAIAGFINVGQMIKLQTSTELALPTLEGNSLVPSATNLCKTDPPVVLLDTSWTENLLNSWEVVGIPVKWKKKGDISESDEYAFFLASTRNKRMHSEHGNTRDKNSFVEGHQDRIILSPRASDVKDALRAVLGWLGNTAHIFEQARIFPWTKPKVAQPDRCHALWKQANNISRTDSSQKIRKVFADIVTRIEMTAGLQALVPLRPTISAEVCGRAEPVGLLADEQAYWRGEYESSKLFKASKVFEECAMHKFAVLSMATRALKSMFAIQEAIASMRLPVAFVKEYNFEGTHVKEHHGTVLYCGSKAHVLNCFLKDDKRGLSARDCVDMIHKLEFQDCNQIVPGVSIGMLDLSEGLANREDLKAELKKARQLVYDKLLNHAEKALMDQDWAYEHELDRKVSSEEIIACCYSEKKTKNGLYELVTRSPTVNDYLTEMMSLYFSPADTVLALWSNAMSMKSTSWEPDNYVRYSSIAGTTRVSSSALLSAADKSFIFSDKDLITTVTPVGYSQARGAMNMHYSNLRFSDDQISKLESLSSSGLWSRDSVYGYQFFPYLTANLWLVVDFSAKQEPKARLVKFQSSLPICRNTACQAMRGYKGFVLYEFLPEYVDSMIAGTELYIPDFDRRLEMFQDKASTETYADLSPMQLAIYEAAHCEMFNSADSVPNKVTDVVGVKMNLETFMPIIGVPGGLATDGGCLDGQIGASVEFDQESEPFESRFWSAKSNILVSQEAKELEYMLCECRDGAGLRMRDAIKQLKSRHEEFKPFPTAPEFEAIGDPRTVIEKKLIEGGNVESNPGPMNVEIVGYKRGRSMISLEIDSDEQEDGPLRIVTNDRVSIASQRFQWASILSGMATILGAAGVAVGQTNYAKLAQCGDVEPNPGPTQTPTGRWRGCVPIQPQSDASCSVALVYKIDTDYWLGQAQIVNSLTEPNVPAKNRQSIKVTAFQLGVYNSGTITADTTTRGAVMVGYLSAFMTNENLTVSNSSSATERVPAHLARFRRIADGAYVDGQGQNPFKTISTSTIHSERQYLVKYEAKIGSGYFTLNDDIIPNKSEDNAIDAYTHTWNGWIPQDRYLSNDMIALDEKRWTVQSSNSNNSFHVDGEPLSIVIDGDIVTEILKYKAYKYVYVSLGISASSLVQTTTLAYNYFQDFFVTVVPRRDFMGHGVSGASTSTVETVVTQKTGTKFNVTADPISVSTTIPVSTGVVSVSGSVQVEQKPGTKLSVIADPIEQKVGTKFNVTADPIEQKAGMKFNVTADPIEQKAGVKFNVTADPIEQKTGTKFNVTADPIEQKAGVKFSVVADPIEQKSGTKFNVTADPVEQKAGTKFNVSADPIEQKPGVKFNVTADPIEQKSGTKLDVSASPLTVLVVNEPSVTISNITTSFPMPVTIMNTALNPVQTFDLSETVISVAEGVVLPVVLSEEVGIKIRTDQPIQVTFPTPQPVIIDSVVDPIPIFAEEEIPVGGTVAAVITGPGRLEPLWVSETQSKFEYSQIDYIAGHNGATNFSLLMQSGDVEPNPGPVPSIKQRVKLVATGTDGSAYDENIKEIAKTASLLRESAAVDQAFKQTMTDQTCKDFLLAITQGQVNLPCVMLSPDVLREVENELIQDKTGVRLRTNDITNPRVPDELMELEEQEPAMPGDSEGSKKPQKPRKAKMSKQKKFSIVVARVSKRLSKLSEQDFVAWLLYSQATVGWKVLMLAWRMNSRPSRTFNFKIRGEDWERGVEMGLLELRSAILISAITDSNNKLEAVNAFPHETPVMQKLADPLDYQEKRKTAYGWQLQKSTDMISKLSFPTGSASEIDLRNDLKLVSATVTSYDFNMKSYLTAGDILMTEPLNELELSAAFLGTSVGTTLNGEGQTNFSLLKLCGDVEEHPGPVVKTSVWNFDLLKLAGDVESNPGPTWSLTTSDDIESDKTVAEIADDFEVTREQQNEGRFPPQLYEVHVLNNAQAMTTLAKFSTMARLMDYTSPMSAWAVNAGNQSLENAFTSWPIKSVKIKLEEVSLAKLSSFFTIESPSSLNAVTARINEVNRVLGAYTRQIAEVLAKSQGVYNPTRQTLRLLKYYIDMLAISEEGRRECYTDNAEWGASINRDFNTAANVRVDMMAAPFVSGVRYAARIANAGDVWPGANPAIPAYNTPNIDDTIGPYFELGSSKLAAAAGLVRVAAANVASQFDVYEPRSIDPTGFITDTQLTNAQANGAAGPIPAGLAVPAAVRPVALLQPTYSWGGINPIRGTEPTWNMIFTTVPSDVVESLGFRTVRTIILPLWLADTTLNGLSEYDRALYLSMYIAMYYPRLGRAMIKFTPTTHAGAIGLRKHLVADKFDEEQPDAPTPTLFIVPVTANQAEGNYFQTSSMASMLYYGSTVQGVSHGANLPGQALPPQAVAGEIAANTRMRLSTGAQIAMHDAASYIASWVNLWTPGKLYAFMKLPQMKYLFHQDILSEVVDMLAYTHVKFPQAKNGDGNYGDIAADADWRAAGNSEGYVMQGFNTAPDPSNAFLVDFTQGTLYDTRMDPRGASQLIVTCGTDTITSLVIGGWASVSTENLKSFSELFGREGVMSPGQPLNFLRYLKLHATIARARYGYHIANTGLPRIVWNQSKKTAWDLQLLAAPAAETTAVTAISDIQELGNTLYAEYSGSEVELGVLPELTSGFGKLLNEATFPSKVTRPAMLPNSRAVTVLAAGADPAQQNVVKYNLGLGANFGASVVRVGFEFIQETPSVNWLPFPLFVYAKFCKHNVNLPGAIGQARCAGLGVDLTQLSFTRNTHSRNRFKISDLHSGDEYMPTYKVSLFDLVKAYAALYDIAVLGAPLGQIMTAMLNDGAVNSGQNTSLGLLSRWVQPVALKTAFNDNAVVAGAISGALINTSNSRLLPIMALDGYAMTLTLTEPQIRTVIPNVLTYHLSSRVERGFSVAIPKVFTSEYITTNKNVDLLGRFKKVKGPAAVVEEDRKDTKSQDTPGEDERQTLGDGASQEGSAQ